MSHLATIEGILGLQVEYLPPIDLRTVAKIDFRGITLWREYDAQMKGIDRPGQPLARVRASISGEDDTLPDRVARFRSMPEQRRLWYLGDRLLDALEGRNLRDQYTMTPGLQTLLEGYYELLGLRPRRAATTIHAHELVIRAMRVLSNQPAGED